jgi:hypothetical protein
MTLSDLGPNWALIKRPWNWFIVAFSLVLLIFVLHIGVNFFAGASTKGASTDGN